MSKRTVRMCYTNCFCSCSPAIKDKQYYLHCTSKNSCVCVFCSCVYSCLKWVAAVGLQSLPVWDESEYECSEWKNCIPEVELGPHEACGLVWLFGASLF